MAGGVVAVVVAVDVEVDVDVDVVDVGGLRHSMSTCAWRGVIRVTRASTPDVMSGWRGGARTAAAAVALFGVADGDNDDDDDDDDDNDDTSNFDPSGSTCITGFTTAWLFSDLFFPSLALSDARCTRPATDAQI